MKNGMRTIVFAVLVAASLANAQGLPSGDEQAILARVGTRAVTEKEFLWRFELTPGPRRQGSKLEEEKAILLYSLVAEKLLAGEARRKGLDKDSAAISALEGLRKVLARDELYRVEISQNVRVTNAEIQTQARRALRRLSVEYLYLPDSVDASVLRKTMKTGRPLSTILTDSSLAALYDTVTVFWGEAEPEIEDAAYHLTVGEISPVIQASKGFYILRLLRTEPNPFFVGMQASVLRERVEKTIRLRKERERLDAFVAETLKDKVGYGVGPAMAVCVKALRQLAQMQKDSVVKLEPSVLPFLLGRVAGSMDDTIAVAGSRMWSIREILERLCASGFSFDRMLDADALAAKLNLQVRIWVQQELLEQEAVSRHLDERAEVKEAFGMWADSYLAGRMRDELRSDIDVGEVDVWAAIQSEHPTVPLPRTRVEVLWTASLERMRIAIDSLMKGMPFESAVTAFGEQPKDVRVGRYEEYSIGDQPPIGALAWRTDVGRWYGPVRNRDGYLAFNVIEKKVPPEAADSLFARKAAEMRSVLLSAKKRGRLNSAIAALARESGYTVFEDRLRDLKVTRIPMVTFKVIGFGGRMFAVPFIDRQIEWLDQGTEDVLP